MSEAPLPSSRKRRDLIRFLFIIGLLLLFNFVAQRLFFRLDLTEEKRYTMSPATKQLLQNLPEPVTVTVYLDGDFPPAFRRLQQAVRETLNEMQVYGGANLRYIFVDPRRGHRRGRKSTTLLCLKRACAPPTLPPLKTASASRKSFSPGPPWPLGPASGKCSAARQPDRFVRRAPQSEHRRPGVRAGQHHPQIGPRPPQNHWRGRRPRRANQRRGRRPDRLLAAILRRVPRQSGRGAQPAHPRRGDCGQTRTTPTPKSRNSSSISSLPSGGKALFFVDAMRVNLDSAAAGRYALVSLPAQPGGFAVQVRRPHQPQPAYST